MSRAKAPRLGRRAAYGRQILAANAPPRGSVRLLKGAAMAKPQRHIEGLEGDRQCLEHIARRLEGRVLPGAVESRAAAVWLTPEGVVLLLEAVPAAVGILVAGTLVHVNAAFAYAFGYRSPPELLEAGGLDE